MKIIREKESTPTLPSPGWTMYFTRGDERQKIVRRFHREKFGTTAHPSDPSCTIGTSGQPVGQRGRRPRVDFTRDPNVVKPHRRWTGLTGSSAITTDWATGHRPTNRPTAAGSGQSVARRSVHPTRSVVARSWPQDARGPGRWHRDLAMMTLFSVSRRRRHAP